MKATKILLRKLINEEINRLEEVGPQTTPSEWEQHKPPPKPGAGYDIAGMETGIPESFQKIVNRVCSEGVSKYGGIKGVVEEGDNMTVHWTKGTTSEFPSSQIGLPLNMFVKALQQKCPKAFQAGKGAKPGAGKKKARKDIFRLQRLLKARFGKKINLGRTGKNKDGVDGVYGGKTQRAINLLRKTDGGPKRQANFTKSIAALIAHLEKGGPTGPSPSAAVHAKTLRGAIPMSADEQGDAGSRP